MKKTLHVEGMMCGHCEARVKKALEISLIASEIVSVAAFLIFQFAPMSVVSLQEMTFPSASITPMVVCAASLSWSSTP